MPLARAMRASSASAARPSGPISAKPELKTMAPLMPFPAHALTAATVAATGKATIATSIPAGRSSTEGTAASPCTSLRLGLTGKIFPLKPPRIR